MDYKLFTINYLVAFLIIHYTGLFQLSYYSLPSASSDPVSCLLMLNVDVPTILGGFAPFLCLPVFAIVHMLTSLQFGLFLIAPLWLPQLGSHL